MTQTPRTQEQYTSHIPALQVLMGMGWEFMSAADCLSARGGNKNVLMVPVLVDFLKKHTFEHGGKSYPLSTNAIEQVVREISNTGLHDGLATANKKIYEKLTLGITVKEFTEDGKAISVTVPLIKWDAVNENTFHVTEELEVMKQTGMGTRRPDVIAYVNGIPLAVIEAKKPASGNANKSMVDEGISQNIRNQKDDEIPLLFAYAQLLMSVSNTDARYATTKTPKKFWAKWREEEFEEKDFHAIKNKHLTNDQKQALFADKPAHTKDYFDKMFEREVLPTEQDRLIISLLKKDRFLEFVKFFIIFDNKVGKIAARYQQAFGIKALLGRINKRKPEGGREGGVLWHTTGSGKSFTMVFLCKALLLEDSLKNCRVIVVTDRIDLEKQLAKTFITGGAFGSAVATKKDGESAKVSTGKDLAKRIGKGNERIIFSIINKFNTASKQPECFNDSEDLIVLIDEGHRSQNGENHERMRKALPNASYIAFTGTPLLKDDKTTNKFGSVIHAYTMQRAVEDGTVTPLLYEERKPLLDVNNKAIDNWFDRLTANLSDKQKSDLKKKYSNRGTLYGSQNRIELIAWDIAIHFSENIKSLGQGLKGQLATDSKLSAVRYKKILDETGLVTSRIIISSPDTREGHADVDEEKLPEVLDWWKKNVSDDPEGYETKALEDFSTDGDPDILIVVDKLLTGFDEPKNAVLYIDKPLKEHNLIQAIARVNRLHEAKKFGLLIDYRGILKELDTAIKDYQNLAEKTQGGFDIEDLEGLYSQVSTEYKRLPKLHKELRSIFSAVKNTGDIEQYRQILVPRLVADKNNPDAEPLDSNEKIRDDFYAALTEFGMCLKTALSSSSFFEDKSFSDEDIATYKSDLKFFTEIRKVIKQDTGETVDFSSYEEQIRKLVDKHVVGSDVHKTGDTYIVNELAQKKKPEEWTDQQARNEKDIIQTRLRKTIEQNLIDDPYAQQYFSEMLKSTIAEAESLFDYPLEQYALFKNLEDSVKSRDVEGTPEILQDNKKAKAFYGAFRLVLGDEQVQQNSEDFAKNSLDIEVVVQKAVEENSLNPQNIEAQIRKSLLPSLYSKIGLDSAKAVIDHIVQTTRTGFAND